MALILAPRWEAAGVRPAEVSVRYPASTGYCFYRYHHDPALRRITVTFTGSANKFDLQILLPNNSTVKSATLNDKPVRAEMKTIELSTYAAFQVNQPGVHTVILEL